MYQQLVQVYVLEIVKCNTTKEAYYTIIQYSFNKINDKYTVDDKCAK